MSASITLPPTMFSEVEQLAQREGRTVGELLQALHDTNPAGLDLDSTTKQLYQSLQPWTWLEGNRMYASFGHLTGYSSNYYTYAFDKVIALDFFAQFDPADLHRSLTTAVATGAASATATFTCSSAFSLAVLVLAFLIGLGIAQYIWISNCYNG